MSSPSRLTFGVTADGQPVRSLTSAVLAHVRAEILSCRLKPGEKVLISLLARRLGVSLSAVREALSRLAAEGLVRAEDQRGFRVTPVSIEDLRDITRTRVDLEGLALRRAIELGDARWEERVRAAHDGLAATPLPPRGEPGPSFERWRMLTSNSTSLWSPRADRNGSSGFATSCSSSRSDTAFWPTASARATSRASTG